MYNEIQLTKNKMDLNNRKISNHPPSPPEEDGLNSQINRGRKSNKKFMQKLLVITLIYPCEKLHPNYLTYINFIIQQHQIFFTNKIFYITQ